MRNGFLLAGLLMMSTACSTFTAKPRVVYHRPDLSGVENKVVVFPTLDFTGKRSVGSQEIDRTVMSNWAQLYGAEKVIPAGPVADKFAEKNPDFYRKLISSFDDVSSIEQMGTNPYFKTAMKKLTHQFGNHHFAFSVIKGDKKAFNNGEPVTIHFGLFDTKNLTWKWITKVEDKKGMLSKWEMTSSAMVSNSFNAAKDLSSRVPASTKK